MEQGSAINLPQSDTEFVIFFSFSVSVSEDKMLIWGL